MSWLWRSDTSPAAYGKVLEKLKEQIGVATSSLDKTRNRSRRAKALWTLYTSITYLISIIILVLVIGPQNWTLPHYGGIVGAPLVIYGVRRAITTVFGWQISRQQTHLNRLEKQREEKLKELKKVTNYDDTQQLIQRYEASSPRPVESQSKSGNKRGTQEQTPPIRVQRTGIAPPATANIAGRNRAVTSPSNGPSPQVATPVTQMLSHQALQQSPVGVEEPGFAPNAFPQSAQMPIAARAYPDNKPHWYDRILDVMLGEDETLAKNRIVLLCQNCRMVNGQAPPGVKTLEELGRWRCQGCGTWNGVQSEVAKVMQEVKEQVPETSPETPSKVEMSANETEATQEQEDATIEEQGSPTGNDHLSEPSTVTKRVTRSSGKSELDGL